MSLEMALVTVKVRVTVIVTVMVMVAIDGDCDGCGDGDVLAPFWTVLGLHCVHIVPCRTVGQPKILIIVALSEVRCRYNKCQKCNRNTALTKEKGRKKRGNKGNWFRVRGRFQKKG